MKIRLFRHATMQVYFSGINFLVDPMLSASGTMPAIQNSPQSRSNPLVGMLSLPILAKIDAVLLTHLHRDHLDDEAIQLLPKGLPVFCQPIDEQKLRGHGFQDIRPVKEKQEWRGITLFRTGGRHGTGEIGEQMGEVSGYVLQATGEPLLYVAGDTIWCEEVKAALLEYQPQVSVVFAGAAQFLQGDPITMTAADVGQVCAYNEEMQVVAVHMEAFNHCLLTRQELRYFAEQNDFSAQLYIPQDGEEIVFGGMEK